MLSLCARVIAFGRELILAYCYGTSMVSDVYLLSMTLPVTLFGFISTGIIAGYIPIYSKIIKTKDQKEASLFTSNILNVLLVVCVIIILAFYFFSEKIISILAIGFTEEAVELAVMFSKISIWAIMFSCITIVFSGYLQINNRMQITALISIPLNLGIVISIFASYCFHSFLILPIGYITACIFQALVILIFVMKEKYKYNFSLNLNSKYVKEFCINIGMLSISSSIHQINVLFDRTLATYVAVGGLSVYEYGSRINDFVMGMTIIPISTAIFPHLSKGTDDVEELKKNALDYIVLFIVIIVPITTIILIYSKSIVTIIYYRGAFGDDSLIMTTKVVFFYGIGLLSFALRELFSKIFYAMSNTKTPMINATIGVTINIISSLILFRYMGISGLALGTSFSAMCSIVILYFSLTKKIGRINLGSRIKEILAVIISTVLCGLVSYVAYIICGMVSQIEIVRFGSAVLIFFVLYMLLLIKMKIIDIMKYLNSRKGSKDV